MQLEITGKHFKVTEGLKDHVYKKIPKLDKYGLKIVSAHVIFEVQKINQICEIVLQGKNLRLAATETTSDLYASFDAAVTNLQKQLARYHDRIKEHRSPRTADLSSDEPADGLDE